MIARAAALVGCVLSVTLGVACSNSIDGRPVAEPGSPTEPTFPTPRPTRPLPPTSPNPTPGIEALPPNAQGYVYIETRSGQTRCQISRAAVGCEAPFDDPPIQDGLPASGVNVTADGALRWTVGNLGNIPTVALDYRTYQAQGWTIVAASDGTRFTNDATGHGMFVSLDRVESF